MRTLFNVRNVIFIIVVILMIIFLLWQNSRIESQIKQTARTEGVYIGKEEIK